MTEGNLKRLVLLATISPDAGKLVKGVWWHEQTP